MAAGHDKGDRVFVWYRKGIAELHIAADIESTVARDAMSNYLSKNQ